MTRLSPKLDHVQGDTPDRSLAQSIHPGVVGTSGVDVDEGVEQLIVVVMLPDEGRRATGPDGEDQGQDVRETMDVGHGRRSSPTE